MPINVLQRPTWTGEPRDLGESFILRKNGREAVCKLLTHQFGWECRLFVGQQEEVVQTQVCRSEEEVFTMGEKWKTALQEKDWH
jgi:hypothetical protein